MTYWEKELEEIEKGCGKEINHNIHDEITICRKEPKGVFIESAQPLTKEGIQEICHSPTYKFELCLECEARKSQLLKDQEEHKKKMEELKEKLKEEIQEVRNHHEEYVIKENNIDFIHYFIDKLFTEVMGK